MGGFINFMVLALKLARSKNSYDSVITLIPITLLTLPEMKKYINVSVLEIYKGFPKALPGLVALQRMQQSIFSFSVLCKAHVNILFKLMKYSQELTGRCKPKYYKYLLKALNQGGTL